MEERKQSHKNTWSPEYVIEENQNWPEETGILKVQGTGNEENNK